MLNMIVGSTKMGSRDSFGSCPNDPSASNFGQWAVMMGCPKDGSVTSML